MAQTVKRPPTMWETQVRLLGQEDPLEKEMATHSSILAWKIPWMEEPGGLQSTGSQRVGHNWATQQSTRLFLSRFLLREVPLAIVVKLVWRCWILLTFACLESFWFLHQIWRTVLLGRVFSVVGSSLSSFLNMSCHSLLACSFCWEISWQPDGRSTAWYLSFFPVAFNFCL